VAHGSRRVATATLLTMRVNSDGLSGAVSKDGHMHERGA